MPKVRVGGRVKKFPYDKAGRMAAKAARRAAMKPKVRGMAPKKKRV